MEYLEDVVDACEAEGAPNDWKGWYRSLLLRDDNAIDMIWRKLCGIVKRLPGRGTEARNASAAPAAPGDVHGAWPSLVPIDAVMPAQSVSYSAANVRQWFAAPRACRSGQRWSAGSAQ